MRAVRWCLLLLFGGLLAGPGHAEDPFEALSPSLGSTDPDRRVEAQRALLLRVDAVSAFPRLLELANEHAGEGLGRGALEALSRLAAPRMAVATDTANLRGGGPEQTGEELLRDHAEHPVRILPSVQNGLQALVPGSERVAYTDLFVGLAAISQKLGVAFVFDVGTREVALMTPKEAIAFHDAWYRGPGREALAWADFLRAQQGVVHDGLDPGMIDVRLAQLLGDDAGARRRAAYVLGRCVAAEDALRSALRTATPARREVLEPVLARHELRRYGDVVLVSDRGGSSALWRMRLDGGGLRQLTTETDDVFLPRPAPDGRHVAYRVRPEEPPDRLAVLSLVDDTPWPGPTEPIRGHRWSPHGRYLAYATGRGTPVSVHLLDTRTWRTRPLGAVRRAPMARISLPTWHPDKAKMVYTVEGRLVEEGLAAGGARDLATGRYRSPQFVGDDLVVVRTVDEVDTLVRLKEGGGEVDYPRPVERRITQVAMSPDGRFATLGTTVGDGPRGREIPPVYLLNLEGEPTLKKVGQASFGGSLWAPTSDKLAVDAAYRTLLILDREGNPMGESRDNTSAQGAIWSPQGDVLYASQMLELEQGLTPDRMQTRFRLLRWRGGAWETMREVTGWLGLRRVTPDGRWLILASEDTGDRELIAASADGRFWINLTEHPADDHTAVPLPSR